MTKTLDLGCGPNPKNPYNASDIYGIDIVDFGNPNIKVADLIIDPIPFEDNTFDYVTGFDFLEHVPRILYDNRRRTQPFIDVMSEVWRILKPNGMAYFHTPAYPHPQAFQDPQHVNYITEHTVPYFCNYFHDEKTNCAWSGLELGRMYGFKGEYELISQRWSDQDQHHLIWELKAVK